MSFFPAVKLIDESGDAYGVKHVGNKIRTVSQDYLYAVAEGDVPDHSIIDQLGYNPEIDADQTEDLWPSGGTYVYPVAEQAMEVVGGAQDDSDTGGATPGTGINSITIYYLDDAFAPHSTDVTMNGTAAVATGVSDIYRVQRVVALSVGTGGSAAGQILVRGTSAGPTYNSIEIGKNRSRQAIWTVPVGKTVYITSMTAGVIEVTNNAALFTLLAKYDNARAAATSFFLPYAELPSGSGGIVRIFEAPIALPAGVDIKVSAAALTNNTQVSCGLRGWYE